MFTGCAGQRHRIAERFHPVDQGADAIGFVADELRQRAVCGVNRFFQKLRGAANAGQRILDLMRQHGRHAAHRTRRAAIQQLAVDTLREAALLQQQNDYAAVLQRGQPDIGNPLAERGIRQIHIALGDRGAALPVWLHQLQQRDPKGSRSASLCFSSRPTPMSKNCSAA